MKRAVSPLPAHPHRDPGGPAAGPHRGSSHEACRLWQVPGPMLGLGGQDCNHSSLSW